MDKLEEISRVRAVEILVKADLGLHSVSKRVELLDALAWEDWSDEPGWKNLDPRLREDIKAQRIQDPEHPRWDAALMVPKRFYYIGVRNDFILKRLWKLGHQVARIVGQPEILVSCPCCGLRTLEERNVFDICPVCWWEDDGQDSMNAQEVWPGPNGGMSLTEARLNYLQFGIFNPARQDLRPSQSPSEMFEQGRYFVADFEAGTVLEMPQATPRPQKPEKP